MSGTACELARKRNHWLRRLARAALPPLLRLAMFACVFGGAGYGVGALWEKGMSDPRFRIAGDTLALAGAARECPESHSDLERLGLEFDGRSLLDPLLVADINRSYGRSVWIKRVLAARRNFPDRVEVEYVLRVPMAQVRQDGRYWLIDGDAVLLPGSGGDRPAPGLPEVTGDVADTLLGRPEPGGTWSDGGVRGALGLLRVFWSSSLAQALPIRRIVVSGGVFTDSLRRERPKRLRFEVETVSGAVIRWGTFNDGDVAGELGSGEKLEYLRELLQRGEALRPGICFDVRTRLPGYAIIERGGG